MQLGGTTDDAIELAAAVAGRVVLSVVRLIKSSSLLMPGAATVEHFQIELSLRTRVLVKPDEDVLLVIAGIDLAGRSHTKNPSDEEDLRIGAEFALRYTISSKSGFDAKHFDQFGAVNGVYNAWPYFREFIQSTTSRMGLTPFLLPVFRITPPKSPVPSPPAEARE